MKLGVVNPNTVQCKYAAVLINPYIASKIALEDGLSTVSEYMITRD